MSYANGWRVADHPEPRTDTRPRRCRHPPIRIAAQPPDIVGSRGIDVSNAVAVPQNMARPADTWTGVRDHSQNVPIESLPSALVGCPAVAYNFELEVLGLSTDCYQTTPASREVNLVVYEP